MGAQEHRIDMKSIEPYKRVISHGGIQGYEVTHTLNLLKFLTLVNSVLPDLVGCVSLKAHKSALNWMCAVHTVKGSCGFM